MNRVGRNFAESRASQRGAEVLLTGATGFLGKVVLEELVRRRDELGITSVHVLVRPSDDRSAVERFEREIVASDCFSRLPDRWFECVRVVEGELTRPDMNLAPEVAADLAEHVTELINCAASVEFDLALAEATSTNIMSALNVLEFAKRCGALRAMVNVSTAYVTPKPENGSPIREELVDLPFDATQVYESILAGIADRDALLEATGHPNTYTFTKCLAEHLLTERREHVPLKLVRPSIISAAWQNPFPGWIDSTSAFAAFVLLAGIGYLRAIRGREETVLDIVPVDTVADRVIDSAFEGIDDDDAEADSAAGSGAASEQADEPSIEHAVAGVDHGARVDLCRDVVTSWFRRHPVMRGPKVAYLGNDDDEFRKHEQRHNIRQVAIAARWYAATRQTRKHHRARRLVERLTYINEAFPYFTQNTFRFATTKPLTVLGFDTKQYIEIVCRGVYRHLLGLDESEATLAGSDRQGMSDIAWARYQPQGNWAHRISSIVVSKGLRRTTDRITFDRPSFERARLEVDPGSLLVIVPTHRSYMDFVLCSYLAFAHPDLGIPVPHVAAAREFSHIPALGWLLEQNQAFYIDRNKGQADPELTRRVRALADRQHTLEFFIEGTRSRARRFLAPKRGILRSLQSTGVPCTILPIAISYDHVPEERPFLEELGGGSKPDMKLGPLLAWTAKLFAGQIDVGRVHMVCGNPHPMDNHTDVVALSRSVMGELQEHTVTTTHHIRTFLHYNPIRGADERWLREAIEARGGTVIDSPIETHLSVPPSVERSMRSHWMHLFYPEAVAVWPDHHVVGSHIERNAYAPSARRKGPELPTDPRVVALLERLFAPISDDYAFAASSLAQRREAGGSGSAAEFARQLVQREPTAFLADLEDALDHLAARQLIEVGDDDGLAARVGREVLELHAQRCSDLSPSHEIRELLEERV